MAGYTKLQTEAVVAVAYGTNITDFTNFAKITLVIAVTYSTKIINFTNFTKITLVAAVVVTYCNLPNCI